MLLTGGKSFVSKGFGDSEGYEPEGGAGETFDTEEVLLDPETMQAAPCDPTSFASEVMFWTVTWTSGTVDKDGECRRSFFVGPRLKLRWCGGLYMVASPRDYSRRISAVSFNKVTRLTIFFAQRVISAWLRRWWVSTPLVWSTKQCPWCVSHQMVDSSWLYALIWVSCFSSNAGGISLSCPLFFDLLAVTVLVGAFAFYKWSVS